MYTNLSIDCHMPVPHPFPLQSLLKTTLTQKVEDQDVGGFYDDRSHHPSSLKATSEEKSVERRCDEICFWSESCCCDRAGFSLTDASGGGIGDPAGRPTRGHSRSRHTGSDLQDNNDSNNNEHRRRSNFDIQEDSGVEELVSEVEGTVERVRSSVARGSCKSDVVEGLVEGLSIATTKITTTATMYDNDDDDNNDNDEARRATFNAGHVDAPVRRKLHCAGTGWSSQIKDRVCGRIQ